MDSTAQREEVFLGEAATQLAGTQYCEAGIRPGETANLEREPDNRHDRNAIRVENEDFDKVGYLPRRVVSWLAPLVDGGQAIATARVPEEPPARAGETPLRLALSLAPKGHAILDSVENPASADEALHQVVLAAYRQSESWRNPQVIEGLEKRLQRLANREMLPATRLLLALLPYRARMAAAGWREEAARQVRDAFARIEIGGPLHHRNLTVFPLLVANGHEPGYRLLEEAIEVGDAEVTEVSDSGSVPELLLDNRGDQPILVPEGEVVTGAKQNRVLNITILVAPQSQTVLPVSCVEQGRWSHISRGFRATHYAPPDLRARKSASVRRSRRETGRAHSNQGEVWDRVSACLSSARAHSATESLTDGYATSRERVDDYRAHLPLPEQAAGVIVAAGDRIVGMDLSDCPPMFQRLWRRIGEAYFFEAGLQDTEQPATPAQQARDFLDRFAADLEPRADTIGLGTEYSPAGEDLVGSALWHEDRILHSYAFPAV